MMLKVCKIFLRYSAIGFVSLISACAHTENSAWLKVEKNNADVELFIAESASGEIIHECKKSCSKYFSDTPSFNIIAATDGERLIFKDIPANKLNSVFGYYFHSSSDTIADKQLNYPPFKALLATPLMPDRADNNGECMGEFRLSPNGIPIDVAIIECTDSLFETSALNSMAMTRYFIPNTKDGYNPDTVYVVKRTYEFVNVFSDNDRRY